MKISVTYIIGIVFMVGSIIGNGKLSYYIGSSSAFLISVLTFICGAIFIGYSFFSKEKIGTKEQRKKAITWTTRIFFIIIIIFLGLLTYQMYGPSNASIHKECTMNGYGHGTCTFTNTGDKKGYICGYINLMRTDRQGSNIQSSIICSGNIEGHSTVKQEFTMTEVQDFCKTNNTSDKWGDVCNFEFIEDTDDSKGN